MRYTFHIITRTHTEYYSKSRCYKHFTTAVPTLSPRRRSSAPPTVVFGHGFAAAAAIRTRVFMRDGIEGCARARARRAADRARARPNLLETVATRRPQRNLRIGEGGDNFWLNVCVETRTSYRIARNTFSSAAIRSTEKTEERENLKIKNPPSIELTVPWASQPNPPPNE